MDIHFWQEVLTKLYHKLNISMPSIKAIQNFLERLQKNNLGMIALKNNTYTYIDNQYNLFILHKDKLGI